MDAQKDITTEILPVIEPTQFQKRQIVGSQLVGIAFGLAITGTALYHQAVRPIYDPIPQSALGSLVVFGAGIGPTDRFDRLIELLIQKFGKGG